MIFNIFETSFLCSSWLHLFDKKYSKNGNGVKYYYNFKYMFSIWIYVYNVQPQIRKSWDSMENAN